MVLFRPSNNDNAFSVKVNLSGVLERFVEFVIAGTALAVLEKALQAQFLKDLLSNRELKSRVEEELNFRVLLKRLQIASHYPE